MRSRSGEELAGTAQHVIQIAGTLDPGQTILGSYSENHWKYGKIEHESGSKM